MKIQKSTGFTLLELMGGLVLTCLFMGVFIQVSNQLNHILEKQKTLGNWQQTHFLLKNFLDNKLLKKTNLACLPTDLTFLKTEILHLNSKSDKLIIRKINPNTIAPVIQIISDRILLTNQIYKPKDIIMISNCQQFMLAEVLSVNMRDKGILIEINQSLPKVYEHLLIYPIEKIKIWLVQGHGIGTLYVSVNDTKASALVDHLNYFKVSISHQKKSEKQTYLFKFGLDVPNKQFSAGFEYEITS